MAMDVDDISNSLDDSENDQQPLKMFKWKTKDKDFHRIQYKKKQVNELHEQLAVEHRAILDIYQTFLL